MPPDDAGGGAKRTFYGLLSEAIEDFLANGYDGAERLEAWVERIRRAAVDTLTPPDVAEAAIRDTLTAIYRREIDRGRILKLHEDVGRFTLEKLRPKLRDELRRRIMSSAGLIKLNRDAAIERTVQRFAGWASSIPPGGTEAQGVRDTAKDLRKSLAQLPYEERRVVIDQGHKFVANLSEIIAVDNNAIAGVWRSHWREANYNFRKDHKERDKQVYAVRGSWAVERGLITKGAGWTDDISKPGEEVFCRCFYRWVYNLRDLPADMLTEKGRQELERAREQIRRGAGRPAA